MMNVEYTNKRGPQEGYQEVQQKQKKIKLNPAFLYNANSLPSEIIREIFIKADAWVIGALLCTCKQWNNVGTKLTLKDYCNSLVHFDEKTWEQFVKKNNYKIEYNPILITKIMGVALLKNNPPQKIDSLLAVVSVPESCLSNKYNLGNTGFPAKLLSLWNVSNYNEKNQAHIKVHFLVFTIEKSFLRMYQLIEYNDEQKTLS